MVYKYLGAVADDLWLAFCAYVRLQYLLPHFEIYFVTTRSSKKKKNNNNNK